MSLENAIKKTKITDGTDTALITASGELNVLATAQPGVDIGDVTINNASIPVTDNSGSLTVDAPVGTPVFVRLSDGAAAIATLPVSLASVPSHAVTNAGTFVVQENGAALTSLQLIDDTVFVLGTDTYTEAASKGLGIGAVRRDADTTLVNTTNEWGPLQMDANGRLKVEVFSGETLPVSLTSTTITGTVAVTQSGTWILGANSGVDIGDVTINNAAGVAAVNIQDGGNSITVDGTITEANSSAILTSLQLIDDAVYASDAALSKTLGIGAVLDDVSTVAITENQAGYLRMSSRRALLVEGVSGGTAIPVTLTSTTITGSVAVTNAGTFVVQENGAALTSLQLIDDMIVADNAAFTDGTTKVAMSGFIFDDVAGTALTENDAAAARIDSKRAVVIVGEDATTRTQKWAISAAGALSSNLTQVAGATIAQGNGTAASAIRVALPTDGTGVVGLNAGTNLVGKVGIDQTTPGTTNAISIAQIGSGTAITGGVTGSLGIGGNVAHDGVDAGNPEIGRAHGWTPVTQGYRMPASG